MAAEVPMFQYNTEQANKLMKSAIPLMAKLDIPPTPYNYGIWYEYVSNRTPKLNQVVDQALRRFGSLPAFVSKEVFNEFLLPEEFQHAHQRDESFKHLTQHLETETSSVSSEIAQFNNTILLTKKALKHYSNDTDQLARLAMLLEQGAFKANQAIDGYSRTLANTQEELAALRSELLDAKKNTELDVMTLLANEKGFERSLFSLAPAAEDDLSLLLVDIDHLGAINQDYGIKVGTSLIRYIAKLLLNNLPENSFIARLNGGQFAILLSETELSIAAQFAETLRHQVSIQKIRYKNTKVLLRQVTVSIGVATLVGDESPKELVERARHYLLYAKRTGKNNIAHHE
ncbi:GGDEF domain-containing protein [Marinomonas sp. M1K-6]|uniref:diguanylate cyclase n=1 Tax=Marinomonas profundi TaxID=2726122 RepID=A0A847R277_9GAMM|nr:GGDEF domain-containing protein [Marinomonas profundi]NLQ16373.1 GGDEF domain-containing protein [Marinomonas profundi]UDV03053.1 GGDEF domain-containing protein [Marinomonas profundi]